MAAKYRKIDPRIWKDEKFRSLDESEKLVAIYCVTAQSNRIGIFTFSPAMASEDLGTLPPTFAKRFGNVCRTLIWEWDSTSRVLYLPTWWKYNRPDNVNVMAGCLHDLDDLPASPLVEKFLGNSVYLPDTFAAVLTKRMGERYPQRSGNVPPQEQEQETGAESGKDCGDAAGGFDGSQRTKKRKPDPLWDAIVAITGADASIKSVASHIGRVKKALLEANPPYTPEDVHALPQLAAVHLPWSAGRILTLGEVEKNIGLTRSSASPVKAGVKSGRSDPAATIARQAAEAMQQKQQENARE